VTTTDLATCCQNTQLQKIVEQCTRSKDSGAQRLRIYLGGVDENSKFNSSLQERFAIVALEHLRQFPAWTQRTDCAVHRVDFHLECGAVMQTLFKVTAPFVRTRVIRTTTNHALTQVVRHNTRCIPTHLQWRVDEDAPVEPKSFKYNRVIMHRCHAFSLGPWIYRVTESWSGRTIEVAQRAMSVSSPRLEITLELKVNEYDPKKRKDTPYLIASMLQHVRDLCQKCFRGTSNIEICEPQ
jgi:hypothetical protein